MVLMIVKGFCALAVKLHSNRAQKFTKELRNEGDENMSS